MKKYVVMILFIVVMVIMSSMLFSDSFAKYSSAASGNIGVGVAVPIFGETAEEIPVPLNAMVPGDNYSYDFYVVNQNDASAISNVSLDYSIRIERSYNLPITITLVRKNESTNLLDNNLTTSIFTLTHSVRTIHNYTLYIDWNSSYNDENWQNLIEAITIYIDIVQKNLNE